MNTKYLTFLCGCLLLFSLTILAQQKPVVPSAQRAEAAFHEGIKALENNKLDVAIQRFREAQKLVPNNPVITLNLGMALYDKNPGDPEAQGFMESVVGQFPEHPDLQLRLLHSYLISKNDERVKSLVEHLQKRMEREPKFSFNVIYTLVTYGRLDLADSELAKTSNRLQGEILFISGMIAAQGNQKAEALRRFEMAAQHGFPSAGSTQMANLAESYFALQEFKLAATPYEAVLKHDLQASRYWFKLGVSYFAIGDHAKAKEQFEKSLRLNPPPPEVNYYLGATLIELKQTREARPFLEAELAQVPTSFKAMTKLAYLDYLEGNNQQCRKRLDQSSAIEANWFETHLVYGMLLSRLGENDQAVKYLEQALKEEPDYWKTHYQLELLYQRLGNEEKAKAYMESYERLFKAITSLRLESRGLAGDKKPEGR